MNKNKELKTILENKFCTNNYSLDNCCQTQLKNQPDIIMIKY